MKISEVVILINEGEFSKSKDWAQIRERIHSYIEQAEWPQGAGTFSIHPEKIGNGVVPIKAKPMKLLKDDGWELEYKWDVVSNNIANQKKGKGSKAGPIDAAKMYENRLIVVEWETGNISSSHRAINKMALGLISKKCVAGVLVVPNMKLATYLTDRIGNIEELRPYIPMWQHLKLEEGVLELIVIEQDSESVNTPRIPKGSDGRSAQGALKLKTKSSKSPKKASELTKKPS